MTDRLNPTGAAGVGFSEKPSQNVARPGEREAGSPDFQTLLEEVQNGEIEFSRHAKERIERRGIELTSDDLALLKEGVRRAESKGSKESLLLMDNNAFVVNVANRTVITAMDQEGMKDKTFTNIDSAILLSRK